MTEKAQLRVRGKVFPVESAWCYFVEVLMNDNEDDIRRVIGRELYETRREAMKALNEHADVAIKEIAKHGGTFKLNDLELQ